MAQCFFKKPLSLKNYESIDLFLNSTDKYLSSLKTHIGGTLLLDSLRHTGFLGLKICIASIKILFKNLIATNILQFLPLYKFSQDHLELFFGSIRSQGGYNNNPTARQFQSAYKKVLVHVELRHSFRGNCVPLEQLQILKCDPVHQINVTSRDYRAFQLDENIDSEIDELVNQDHYYLPDPLSEFSKHIMAYIAGYVVHSLKKKIMCVECISALTSVTRDMYLFSFINKKNKGGLEYPSTDVLEICIQAEQVIKCAVLCNPKKQISTVSVVNKTLKIFVNRNIFSNLLVHGYDQSAFDNHRILLIKAVVNRYTNVRLYHFAKQKTNKSESIRHHSNKIVLFKGQ